MKKVLAIILSIAMLFGVLAINTFAVTVPTISVVTNEGSPIASGSDTYFTVKFENFATHKGMDITITAESGITLYDDIKVTGFDITPSKDENYTFTSSSIHIVDLTGGKNGKITFKAKAATADKKVYISGYSAENGEELFTIPATNGTVEVVKDKPAPTPVSNNTLQQPSSGTFIPYGSVYKEVDGGVVFAKKDANGTFDTSDGDYKYNSFAIPANGIVTFGVTDPIDGNIENALRFGNYFNKSLTGTTTYGTMIFEGDWLAVKEIYIKKGYTVQETLKLFSDTYDTKKESNPNLNYVYYSINGKADAFRVYKFEQTKHLWKSGNVLEYAINIKGVQDNTTYTAAAYFVNNGATTISETVKCETYKK